MNKIKKKTLDAVRDNFTDNEWLIICLYKEQIKRLENTGGTVCLANKQWLQLPKLLEKYDVLVNEGREIKKKTIKF